MSPHGSPSQGAQECSIEMLEQPEEKFRFRYKSEMQGTHGCIHGRSYSKKNKTFPTVQVHNVPFDVTSVRLRIALYTNETSCVPHHHVHKMMWKQATPSRTSSNATSSETRVFATAGRGWGSSTLP